MPGWLASGLVAAALVIASAGPKLWLQRRSAQVDTDRLNHDIMDRLKALGFSTTIDRNTPATAVRAWRKDCRLIARNGDRARELAVIFALEATQYGPVQFGYRGAWSADPAPARAVLERFAQDGAERIGFHVERPAVIALAYAGACKGIREALSGLQAHSVARIETGTPDRP
ncbi:MAG TPA: hypothetical protein VL918_10425 [Sphingobium sp.]|nr:hypothetical protein [Sphingobium sp.]